MKNQPGDHEDQESVYKYTLKKILSLRDRYLQGRGQRINQRWSDLFCCDGVAAGICLYYSLPLVFSWIGGLIAVGLLFAFYSDD